MPFHTQGPSVKNQGPISALQLQFLHTQNSEKQDNKDDTSLITREDCYKTKKRRCTKAQGLKAPMHDISRHDKTTYGLDELII